MTDDVERGPTYKEIRECWPHPLCDVRGGCSGCNYDVGSIIADLKEQTREQDALLAASRESERRLRAVCVQLLEQGGLERWARELIRKALADTGKEGG